MIASLEMGLEEAAGRRKKEDGGSREMGEEDKPAKVAVREPGERMGKCQEAGLGIQSVIAHERSISPGHDIVQYWPCIIYFVHIRLINPHSNTKR